MKRVNFILYILGFVFVMAYLGCASPNGGSSTALNPKTADWGRSTNFKYDFVSDRGANIQVLNGNKNLMEYILDGVDSGKMPAYDYDDISKQLTAKQVKDIFHPVDTVIVYDPNTGFESGEKAVQNELNRPAVQKFRVQQDWAFDAETSQLQSKVVAIAPLQTIYNDDETVRGDLPLFWVKF